MNHAAEIKAKRGGLIRGSILATLSAISLLLCAATLLAWLRNYWAVTSTTASSGSLHLFSCGGNLYFTQVALRNPNTTNAMSGVVWDWYTDIYATKSITLRLAGGRPTFWFSRGGFRLGIWPTRAWPGYSSSGIQIATPHWAIAALLAILPAGRAISIYRKKQQLKLAGRCRHCGYDLRASPECCPECGTPVPTPISEFRQGATLTLEGQIGPPRDRLNTPT
jgi:hypothetical protein